MQWLQDHLALVAPLAVAILDFAMAVSPKLKSSGLIHWVYMSLGGKES